MPTLLTRFFPQSRGLVLFMLTLTISAMGLNPAGKNSVIIAFASLLIQIPLYRYVTEHVNQKALHLSSLQYLYIISALCQTLIVHIFAPSFLIWCLRRLFRLFPNLITYFLQAVFASVQRALSFTEMIARNWVLILFNSARKFTASFVRFVDPKTATGLVKPFAEEEFSVLFENAFANIPIFSIIPTEMCKYSILTYAVKSYALEEFGSRFLRVIIMAMVVSIPIANVEVVTSPHLAQYMFGQGEWSKLRVSVRLLAIIAAYVSSMVSCVMLGIRIAENVVLKRKHRMWTARLLSFALVWIVRVLTWLSTFDGDVTADQQAMLSSTLLVVLSCAGVSLWFTTLQLISDEQREKGHDAQK